MAFPSRSVLPTIATSAKCPHTVSGLQLICAFYPYSAVPFTAPWLNAERAHLEAALEEKRAARRLADQATTAGESSPSEVSVVKDGLPARTNHSIPAITDIYNAAVFSPFVASHVLGGAPSGPNRTVRLQLPLQEVRCNSLPTLKL